MSESVPTGLGKLSDEVSIELPLPPEMIESATKIVEEDAIQQLSQYQAIVSKLNEAREQLLPLISTVEDVPHYSNYAGVDGGIGNIAVTLGGTYASVIGVAYSSKKDFTPRIKVDPIKIPASLGAPHQNYLAMWRQKYEYLVGVEAINDVDCVFFDGTIVPSIFVRYLHSAQLYEMLQPQFIDLFKDCFVDTAGKPCLSHRLAQHVKPIVGIPKVVRSRHFIKTRLNMLNLPTTVSDLMICSLLLKPGEYVRLTPYKDLWLSDALTPALGELHWRWITEDLKDVEKNSKDGLNDVVESIPWLAEHTIVTYYKPHAGVPAIRVEVLDKDRNKVDSILRTLYHDYDRTLRMMFSIHMADRYCKSSSGVPMMIKNLMESKINSNARKNGIVDDDFLAFLNLTFREMGPVE